MGQTLKGGFQGNEKLEAKKRSAGRIPTTHAGSPPRPRQVVDSPPAREEGGANLGKIDADMACAIEDVVKNRYRRRTTS